MKALDLFMSRLTPWVIGAPEPIQRMALADSATEFCEMTNIVQVVTEPFMVTAGTSTYTLDLPAYQTAVMTTEAWYGSSPLNLAPVSLVDNVLALKTPIGSSSVTPGRAYSFYEISPGYVALYPVPDASSLDYLTAKVATKPVRDAQYLDDLLYTDWVEAIVAGARKRLHAIPDQSFSSDQKAAEAAMAFTIAVGRARFLSLRGRVQGSVSVKYRPLV